MQKNEYKNISHKEAVQVQQKLRGKIDISPLQKEIQTVGGADISFDMGSDTIHAAMVVLEVPTLKPVARLLVSDEIAFPYIPGLLAFREMPVLLKAWNQLQIKPDVLILDGHGLAHPRRMGIATHFGIEVDHPTIGCAKNILTGIYAEPGIEKGSYARIFDGDEMIGLALRSRTNSIPFSCRRDIR